MLDNYRREVLPNGLRVLAAENPALHSFVCSVCVRGGPRFERPDEVGLTHFLEHMLLQGSHDFPSSHEIMQRVEDLGGIVEAQTYPEHIRVTFAAHRKHWRRLMEIACDVILNPLISEEEVEQEKPIVIQEIARHRDRSGRNIDVHELAYGLLLTERPDEAGMWGSQATVESLGRQAVRALYERLFVPENMVVCLAGGLDREAVLEEMRRCFGPAPGDGRLPELLAPTLERRRARCTLRRTEARPVVEAVLSHHAYAMGSDRFDALRAVARLLGGGLSSRLFAHVREELSLVYEVESYPFAFSDTGALNTLFSVSTDRLTEALTAVLDVLRKATEGGFTHEELERYKESARCGVEMLCDDAEHVADWYGRQEVLLGADNVVTPQEYVRRQEALTLDDLQGVLDEVLVTENANLAVAGPFGDEEDRDLRRVFPAEEAVIGNEPGT